MSARANMPRVVRNGLVIDYAFDAGQGTILPDPRGGYDGTLGTSASDRPDWVAAGLSFVAANADVVINSTLPDSVFLGLDGFTVCVVASIASGSALRHFLGKHASGGATACPIDFRTDNQAAPRLVLNRANTATRSWTGPATTVGAYRMYSLTAPQAIEGTPIFYVGVTPTAGTGAGTGTGAATGSAATLRMGRRADGAVQMDGTIAALLVYGRQLGAGEITQNYAALKARLGGRGVVLP